MSLSLEKLSIRTSLLEQRKALSPLQVASMSLQAQENLIALPAFERSQTLALYSPIRNEVETAQLLSVALARGKKVYYPCVEGDELHFFRVCATEDLITGCFGISEPKQKIEEVDSSALELLLIPGVAFDLQGARIGYGRGYFDRLLSDPRFSGLSVGFGYEFQVKKLLPTEHHDQNVALLVTDKKIYSPLSCD